MYVYNKTLGTVDDLDAKVYMFSNVLLFKQYR